MTQTVRMLASVCLIALAASCGSDDDDAGDPPAGTSAEAAAPDASETSPPDEPGAPDSSPTDEPTLSESSPAAGPVCDLATDEEISAIVANDVLGVDIDATLCEYSLVSGTPAVDGTAVDVFTNVAFDDVCSLELDLVGAGDGQPIDGLGTTAFWEGGTQTAQLFICTGTSFVTITQYKPPAVTDEQALVRAQEVADIVLSRL